MKKELQDKFFERWPKWFDRTDMRSSLMCFGFGCGDGWYQLLWDLCEKIEPLAGDDFEIVQVKEKFGGLRFYVQGGLAGILDLIYDAEQQSEATCERCGKPGTIRNGGWLRCLCDECND